MQKISRPRSILITQISFCLLCVLLSFQVFCTPKKSCLNFHVIHSEPLGYFNAKNIPTGVHWEYLKAIEKHSNICFNIELMPYARIWKSIEDGKHDGGILFKSKDRTHLVKYVEHIKTVPTVVIPLQKYQINKYSDLETLAIGVMRGSYINDKFDKDKSLNIIKLLNYEQGARMIDLQRIDAIAGNQLAVIYQLKKFNVLRKVNIEKQIILGKKEQWLQFSNRSSGLNKIPFLTQSIRELKQNGTFDSIFKKYYF